METPMCNIYWNETSPNVIIIDDEEVNNLTTKDDEDTNLPTELNILTNVDFIDQNTTQVEKNNINPSPDVIIIGDDEEERHVTLNSRKNSSNCELRINKELNLDSFRPNFMEEDAKDLLDCLNEWETGPTINAHGNLNWAVNLEEITNSVEKDCEIIIIDDDLTEESEFRLQELEIIPEETEDKEERSLKFKIEREIIEKQHGDNQLRFEVTGLLGYRQFRGLFERDDKELEVITKYKPVERLSQLKPGEDINMSVSSLDCNSLQTKILASNNFKPLSIPEEVSGSKEEASRNKEEVSRDTTPRNVPVSSMARRMQELVKNAQTKKRKIRNKGEEINRTVNHLVELKKTQIELNMNYNPLECLSQMEASEEVNMSVSNPKQIKILGSNDFQPLPIPKEVPGPQKIFSRATTSKNVLLNSMTARLQELLKNTPRRTRKIKCLDVHKGEEINREVQLLVKPQVDLVEEHINPKLRSLEAQIELNRNYKPIECLSQKEAAEEVNMTVSNPKQIKILASNNFQPLLIPKEVPGQLNEASSTITSKNVPINSMPARKQELVKNTQTGKINIKCSDVHKGEEVIGKVQPLVKPQVDLVEDNINPKLRSLQTQIELNKNYKPIKCLSQMEVAEEVNMSVSNPKKIKILASYTFQPLSIPKEVPGTQKEASSATTSKNVPLMEKLKNSAHTMKRKLKCPDLNTKEIKKVKSLIKPQVDLTGEIINPNLKSTQNQLNIKESIEGRDKPKDKISNNPSVGAFMEILQPPLEIIGNVNKTCKKTPNYKIVQRVSKFKDNSSHKVITKSPSLINSNLNIPILPLNTIPKVLKTVRLISRSVNNEKSKFKAPLKLNNITKLSKPNLNVSMAQLNGSPEKPEDKNLNTNTKSVNRQLLQSDSRHKVGLQTKKLIHSIKPNLNVSPVPLNANPEEIVRKTVNVSTQTVKDPLLESDSRHKVNIEAKTLINASKLNHNVSLIPINRNPKEIIDLTGNVNTKVDKYQSSKADSSHKINFEAKNLIHSSERNLHVSLIPLNRNPKEIIGKTGNVNAKIDNYQINRADSSHKINFEAENLINSSGPNHNVSLIPLSRNTKEIIDLTENVNTKADNYQLTKAHSSNKINVEAKKLINSSKPNHNVSLIVLDRNPKKIFNKTGNVNAKADNYQLSKADSTHKINFEAKNRINSSEPNHNVSLIPINRNPKDIIDLTGNVNTKADNYQSSKGNSSHKVNFEIKKLINSSEPNLNVSLIPLNRNPKEIMDKTLNTKADNHQLAKADSSPKVNFEVKKIINVSKPKLNVSSIPVNRNPKDIIDLTGNGNTKADNYQSNKANSSHKVNFEAKKNASKPNLNVSLTTLNRNPKEIINKTGNLNTTVDKYQINRADSSHTVNFEAKELINAGKPNLNVSLTPLNLNPKEIINKSGNVNTKVDNYQINRADSSHKVNFEAKKLTNASESNLNVPLIPINRNPKDIIDLTGNGNTKADNYQSNKANSSHKVNFEAKKLINARKPNLNVSLTSFNRNPKEMLNKTVNLSTKVETLPLNKNYKVAIKTILVKDRVLIPMKVNLKPLSSNTNPEGRINKNGNLQKYKPVLQSVNALQLLTEEHSYSKRITKETASQHIPSHEDIPKKSSSHQQSKEKENPHYTQ